MITIDDFKKVEMKVGEVVEVEEVPESEKILKLSVNFGSETRTIFSGIKKWYGREDLINKKFLFVTNLEPKEMSFGTSEGMILAACLPAGRVDAPEKPVLLIPAEDASAGSVVK